MKGSSSTNRLGPFRYLDKWSAKKDDFLPKNTIQRTFSTHTELVKLLILIKTYYL
jgi:hypothetical protein